MITEEVRKGREGVDNWRTCRRSVRKGASDCVADVLRVGEVLTVHILAQEGGSCGIPQSHSSVYAFINNAIKGSSRKGHVTTIYVYI